jgi:hypothetical protein
MRRDLVIFGCESCTPHYMLRSLMAAGLSAREAARQVEAAESADFAKRSDDKDWKPHQIKRSKNPRMVEKNVRTGAIREIKEPQGVTRARKKASGMYDDFIAGAREIGAIVSARKGAEPVAYVSMLDPSNGLHPTPKFHSSHPQSPAEAKAALDGVRGAVKSLQAQGYVVDRTHDAISLIGRMQKQIQASPHDWQSHAILADMLADAGHEQESISHRAQAFPPWQPGQKMATLLTPAGPITTLPPVPENTARVVLANSLPPGRRRDVLAHLIMDGIVHHHTSYSGDPTSPRMQLVHIGDVYNLVNAVTGANEKEFLDALSYLEKEPKYHQLGQITIHASSDMRSNLLRTHLSWNSEKSNRSASDNEYYRQLSI